MTRSSSSVFLVAGERSGDAYGGLLIRRLRELDAGLRFVGLGGSEMVTAGMETPFRGLGSPVMGWTGVVRQLSRFRKTLKDVSEFVVSGSFGTVILIDYPGFNMRLAARIRAKCSGIKIIYFVLPQVWAWGAGRLRKIAALTDLRISILPFEQTFYEKHDVCVKYFGHPLAETMGASSKEESDVPDLSNVTLGVLPGSRAQEVNRLLPVIIDGLNRLPRTMAGEILVSAVEDVPVDFYRDQVQRYQGGMAIHLRHGSAETLLEASDLAIVKSGTGTLQAALTGTPHVVIYKTGLLNYLLARALVDVPYISLVNLVAGAPVVRELVQHRLNATTLSAEVLQLAANQDRRKTMRRAFTEVREKLSGKDTMERISQAILSEIWENIPPRTVKQTGVIDEAAIHTA